MLVTPFGNISIDLDDKRVSYEIQKIEANSKVFPDVEAYLIRWKYQSDGRRHFLRCVIDCEATEVHEESGERLEMTSIYSTGGKLSIGVEADFTSLPVYEYDFNGKNLANGIEVEIYPETETQYFIFGVAWLMKCNEENDVQTWFAADSTITGTQVNWTKHV